MIELQKRAQEGAEIHSLLSELIHGKEVKTNARTESFLSGYRLWSKTNGIELYFTDVFVFSDHYKYSGFIDAVGMDKAGNLVVVDFKSGKGVYNSYALQLAAYIVHFQPSSANFDFLRVENVDRAFDLFLHCKALSSLDQGEISLFSKSS